ncbi:MAG TPA: TonB-dependent receptor [Allosphingosinicella sp.]|jgi:outer membrane receptor protein involved in Fe transport
MRKFGLLGTSALGSFTFIGLSLALASPAVAQDAAEDDAAATQTQAGESEAEIESGTVATAGAQGESADSGTITVTGSRIRRPNLESNVPITSLGGEEFFQQGNNNIGDMLNELPQLRSTFGQQNAGRFLGTTGLNLLDLRGLGTQRTLVLVNGRRHVPADILNNGVSPDVNTIPNDLVERVDIVTGGNSAIYGSDAIAGVVNFILRRDFEGLQVRGHAGISGYGAGGNQYVSAMAGMNFGGDRGNITLHGEYAHQERLYGQDVPFLRRVDGFLVQDVDIRCIDANGDGDFNDTASPFFENGPTCDPLVNKNNSDGIPDRAFFRDIRAANINQFTQIAFAQRNVVAGGVNQQPGGPQCGVGLRNSPNNGPLGTPYSCIFFFSPDGQTLTQQTGTRVGTGPIGSFIGGNGPTGREGVLLTVLPFQERFNTNLLAHFTVSEAFEPFIEAKYVRVNTQGQNSSPVFVQGSTLDANRERIRLDNPFLTPEIRNQIANLTLGYNTVPSSAAQTAGLTATQIANIANGSFRFPIQRFFTDLGSRDERSRRETFRAVVGARGTFNDDWNYEISANYGKVKEDTTILGNVDIARLLLSLDAGRAAPGAAITCRSQFSAAAQLDPFGFGAERLAADVAACVPYNPFGTNPEQNAAARAYITRDTTAKASLNQLVLSAFAAGDTSEWFELPGGPVRFAGGLEYRRERLFYEQDEFVSGGFSFYNAIPTFDSDKFEVKEAYAEIQIPILKDTPFFEELSVNAAARIASYGGSVGSVWAYNAGAEWSPIRDIRFRANYGRSVRAPNLTETAFPQSQNFAPGFADPCRPQNIGQGSPSRATNCAADLGALLADPSFQALPNYSVNFFSGSNPLLEEETSDSWTIGAIIQPRFLPGLSISVDYYDITVDKVINTPSFQTVANGCYDLPDLNNQFCALFERYLGPAPGPNLEITGQILDVNSVLTPLNFAALERRGVDFEVAYRRNLGANTSLSARLIYSRQLTNSNFTSPSNPNFENRILQELGDPRDEFQFNLDLKHGPFTFGYEANYIGKQVVNLYEDFFEVPGACTPQSCPPNDADYADIRFYPAVVYHDIRLAWDVSKEHQFYVGVDNIMDRNPPLGLTGVGAGSGIYSIRGRNFYAGFRARF